MNQALLTVDALETIDFGQDAAENENDLEGIFVNNLVYAQVLADSVDLIAGQKGTGKSAIYRMITEVPVASELTVIPAVNPTGTPVFKVLFRESASEDRLRGIWSAYVAAQLGNWVVDTFAESSDVRKQVAEIKEVLVMLGLRRPPSSHRSLLSRIRRAKSVEMGVEAAGATATLGGTLKFDLPDADSPGTSITLEYSDFHAVIVSCAEVLSTRGRRAWLAFDRLDECFMSDTEVERRALRALLRTHLDVAQALGYKGHFRLKIFLRTDLLRRMSADASFTNSTHLRQADLRWTSSSIADLVHQRLIKNRVLPGRGQGGAVSVHQVWAALMPELYKGKRLTRAHMLCEWTSDGHRGFNPRNVITLLRIAIGKARESENRARDRGAPARDVPPLLQMRDITSAMGELSRKRLQDTVLNEFPRMAKHVRNLESSPVARFESMRAFMTALGHANSSSDVQGRVADEICLSGLVGRKGDTFTIPRLYRAALVVSEGKPSTPVDRAAAMVASVPRVRRRRRLRGGIDIDGEDVQVVGE